MLGADDVTSAEERVAEYTDDRLSYYWDSKRAAALAWQELYGLPKPAWDMYFLYGPKTKWADAVTMPELGMTGHQPVEDKIQKMDIEVFSAAASKLSTK